MSRQPASQRKHLLAQTLRTLLLGAPLGVTALAAMPVHASQQRYDIPASSLESVLARFGIESGTLLSYSRQQLQDLPSVGLRGQYTPEAALQQLLSGSDLEYAKTANGFIIRQRQKTSDGNVIDLGTQFILGDGHTISPDNVGRSTLTRKEIERQQADNIPSLLQTLPGVSMGGSIRPGGQTINIWGLGDAEDISISLNGASKSGFERYQQGTVFIEPELIKRIEVEKGPHSVFTGNGGFGGSVHMETKDAPDLLKEGQNVGAMLKYGYQSNDQQQKYSGAVYGRTEDGFADALVFLTKRDGNNVKLADHIQFAGESYRYPTRYPYSDQNLEAGLIKANLHVNDEHHLGLSFSRSHNEAFLPFSAVTFFLPSWYTINRNDGDLEKAMRINMADREVTDTTWSLKYDYEPRENPWLDLEFTYSYSKTEQTDERREGANYSMTSGGKWINTEYDDTVMELRNVSRFDTGALAHELTTGVAWQHHVRDVLMYLPGSTYATPQYNYGWFQPYFMPRGNTRTQSAYVKDAITLGNLTITPSLRFDSVRNEGKANLAPIYQNAERGHDYGAKSYSGWSPRLSLFWRVNDNLGLFADYSKTWRAPVIDEQYELQNSSTIGGTSRQLDPERIRALRAGSVVTLNDLLQSGDNLQVRTTLFHNRISDEIFKFRSIACERQAIEGGSISAKCAELLPLPNYRNIGDLTIKGVEIESYYDSQRIFASLSYAWMTGKHQGAYSNPWGPDVWARDIPPPKWVATLGVKVYEIDAIFGWQGEFVRKTDRVPSDLYDVTGESSWNHFANDSYDSHRLFAEWTPRQQGLAGTHINLTVDNLFNRFYRQALAGDSAYVQGRNAKLSVTRYF
ncbi:TonB-dependent receptor [Stutzerimonas kirkiae]|nr:TonB-dependent receptor [Stutzerimonas kirkiae]